MRVLLERERLGSTGIGGGIGIPHGKLKDLDYDESEVAMALAGLPSVC